MVTLKGQELQRFVIDKPMIIIGRSPECDIALDATNISRQHAKIISSPQREFKAFDMQSTNGTFHNGTKIAQPPLLKDGDVIGIGKFEIVFYRDPKLAPAAGQAVTLGKSLTPTFNEATTIVSKDAPDVRLAIPGTAPRPGMPGFKFPKLVLVSGEASKRIIELQKEETTIGKAKENDLQISGLFYPKYLAKIIRSPKGGDYTIENVEGKSNLKVNGQAVSSPQKLNPQDSIELCGSVVFVFR